MSAHPTAKWLKDFTYSKFFICGISAVLYCIIWDDHGSRGQYDNPEASSSWPIAQSPNVCKVCVFIDSAWQLLVTVHVGLLGEPGAVCLYYAA